MDAQGSVKAARERLSQMQAIRQKKLFEQYQQTMYGSNASDRSAQAVSNNSAELHDELQQPQWPLAPALAPRHIVTATVGSQPSVSDRVVHRSQQMPSKSTKRTSQSPVSKNGDVQPAKPQRKRSLTPKSNSTSTSRKSSQTSTTSSLGSIPDFPVPNSTTKISESLNLRPQVVPTSQQTYYTQFAVVSPIVEERGSGASIKSYASSNVIPQHIADSFYDDLFTDEESNPRTPYKPSESPKVYLEKTTLNNQTFRPAMSASQARSKPLPIPTEAVLSQVHERPNLVRLPSTQYDPAKTTRHTRGTDLEKGSDTGLSLKRAPRSMLGERVGTRRPPNLEFETPKMQEARSSLTSLADLITRATKVRANLDRGKTASRLGNEWAIAARNAALAEQRRQQNIMPSPGPSTPRTDWPSGNSGKEDFGSDDVRCARWSRKTIIFLAILFIILVALAIVIPVVTIVLPRNQAKAAAVSRASTCIRAISCANGGLATQMPNGACACTCVDGFQGTTCNVKSDAACTSISIDGSEATIGASVLPLIKVANSYNIPLDAKPLFDEFKKASMSCANENALVALPVSTITTAVSGQAPTNQSASTINGIVVAGSPTPTAGAGTSTSTTVALVTSVPASIGPGTNSSAQDFAKIGILFVLQDSRTLDMAARAQQSLTSFMDAAVKNGTSRAAATDVALGNGYSINMWDFALKVRNGTVYGKKA